MFTSGFPVFNIDVLKYCFRHRRRFTVGKGLKYIKIKIYNIKMFWLHIASLSKIQILVGNRNIGQESKF